MNRRFVLIRVLMLWLPLTAGTTLLMGPLIGLDEHSRQQTVPARVLRADALFGEIRERFSPNILLPGDVAHAIGRAGDGVVLDRAIDPWFSVLQIPTGSRQRPSIFSNPAGQALIALVVLFLAAGGWFIARSSERTEQARRQERDAFVRMRAVMQQSTTGTCLFEPHSGRVIAANGAFCAFFGLSTEALTDLSWNDLQEFHDLTDQNQLLTWLQANLEPQTHPHVRRVKADGRTIWGDLTVSASRDADGHILDVIGQVNDVTDLLNKTLYLETAASAGLVGIWDWDVARNVLTWDRAMYSLYAIDPKRFPVTFDAWVSALHPDESASIQAELQRALQGGTEFRSRFRICWPDGSVHVLQARSSMECDAEGHPIRMIGVNYDVTDLVQREEELQRQRDLFESTVSSLVDPHLVVAVASAPGTTPQPLIVTDANPAAARFFKRPQPLLTDLPLQHLLHPDGAEAFLQQLNTVLAEGQPLIVDDSPVLGSLDNPELSVDLRAVRVGDHISLSFRDISTRKQAQQQLQESEERFRLLAENVTDVVCILQGGRMTWIAPGLSRLLGWNPSHWQGRQLEDLCHPDDQAHARRVQAEVDAGRRRDYRLRLADDQNEWHWLEIHAGPYRKPDGEQVGSVLSLRLVDREIAVEAELERRARVDELTGLLNRKEILERIEVLARRQRHSDRQIALLFCDIDFFKQINDSHGHAGGDAVLQALAERLRTMVRAGDLVGRIGGDELLVVLDGVDDLEQALEFAQRLHQRVCTPLSLSRGDVTPTLSIGVTVMGAHEAMDAVIARADLAMYQAKQAGRNRVSAIPIGSGPGVLSQALPGRG